jgi:hypothetical protein
LLWEEKQCNGYVPDFYTANEYIARPARSPKLNPEFRNKFGCEQANEYSGIEN